MRGAVTVDHYLGSFNRARVDLTKPPPELVTEFQKSITHGPHARRVAASRALPQGSPRPTTISAPPLGLNASYIASIDGRLLAGFRAASRAYDEHEKVLRLDPSERTPG